MHLNTLKPGAGSQKVVSVSEGALAAGGETCGRGHKGQSQDPVGVSVVDSRV